MPLYTGDAAALVTLGVQGEFNAAYAKRSQEATLAQIATIIEGTSPTLPFGWLGAIPTMRKFLSERQLKNLNANTFTISDETWESTIGFERKLVEDDQIGAAMVRVRDLALEAVNAQERITIQNVFGLNPNGYDGVALVATNHPGVATQSNKSTNALSDAELQAAISNMQQFTDDQGNVMGINPDTLLVGPKNRFNALKLLNSSFYVGSSSQLNLNPLQGSLKLVVSSYLTGAYDDYWFVLDTSREMKSAIFYRRSDVPIEVTLKAANDDDSVFWRNQIVAGARARFNAAPGLWQTCFGGIL